ncbi:hypothetical protein BDV96DRAFT_539743 [Lophiotrema nucula]|uniref:Rhodopsin domain-containing protein n=1 Tax=Lophiotrema nucula TaxID=690887 RepID=A0A6A5ZL83_9PLEO|nr:hypothetical protein BDV96DRAFT_539743 [Lophiotrema nucula]
MALHITKGVATFLPPPDGYEVDFENPKRNGDVTCYWLTGVGSILALLFLGQRLYVKGIVRRRLSFDDGLLIVAWLFSTAIQALIVRAFAFQYVGVHAWEIPFTKFQEYYRFAVYIHTIVYAPPTALTKMVLLLFYFQLQNQAKWFLWATYTTMFINIGASTGIFFASIFACRPIAMGWDLTITDGKCIDRPALYEATAAFGVIVDCLIISIPIPMVLRLQMSRSKKAGLILMFVLGSVTVVTSFVRLVLLVTEIKRSDSTWVAGPINYWVTIEANLLIICASLPTIRQFVRTVAPGLLSITHSSKYNKGSGSTGNLRTIGGITSRSKNARKHGPYDYDTDIAMETLVDGGSSTNAHDFEEGHQLGSIDGDSKTTISETRGITKTQTAEVTYTVNRNWQPEATMRRSFF